MTAQIESPASSSSSSNDSTTPVPTSIITNNNNSKNSSAATTTHLPPVSPSSPNADSSSRSLNWWRLSAIVFVFTSCGPFGIESCVSTGGAFLTLCTVFVTPLVYVIPQILMVSELSMMMPSNHGHIAWVERGWGRFAGAFNAYNAILTNSIDLSLYPVLGGNYFVAHFYPGASWIAKALIRCAMVIIGLLIALRSAKSVSDASLTVSCIIIIPFLFLFIVSIPQISPSTQWSYSPNGDNVDWAAFSASSLWLYTGWNSLGSLGGDVDTTSGNENESRRVFVKGLSFALFWDILMYLLPLISALTVPNGKWDDGFLSVAFGQLLPGAGLVVSICGMISTMGLFVSSLACYARLIWGMADLGWLPKFLAKADAETHSPITATIAQVLMILPLLFLSFSYLQRLEFCLAAVSYLLTFGAFLRLRYLEPNAKRPYLVPGGLPVAWLITMSKVFVFVWILISNFNDSSLMIGVATVNASIAAGYYYYSKKYPEFAQSHGFVHEDDAEAIIASRNSNSSSRGNIITTDDEKNNKSSTSSNSQQDIITSDEESKKRNNSNNDDDDVELITSKSRKKKNSEEEIFDTSKEQSSSTSAPSLKINDEDQNPTIRKRTTSAEKMMKLSSGKSRTNSKEGGLDDFNLGGHQ